MECLSAQVHTQNHMVGMFIYIDGYPANTKVDNEMLCLRVLYQHHNMHLNGVAGINCLVDCFLQSMTAMCWTALQMAM